MPIRKGMSNTANKTSMYDQIMASGNETDTFEVKHAIWQKELYAKAFVQEDFLNLSPEGQAGWDGIMEECREAAGLPVAPRKPRQTSAFGIVEDD